jgi:transposase
MRRFELTDEQRKLIAPVLPRQQRGGRWNDHRQTLNGMLWVLRCGSPWRDMPERYGSWKTVYSRFRRWTDDSTFDKILARLQARIDRDGLIDWDTWRVDGSNIRASKAAAGGGQRGALQSPAITPSADPEADPEADSGPRSIWFVVGSASPSA